MHCAESLGASRQRRALFDQCEAHVGTKGEERFRGVLTACLARPALLKLCLFAALCRIVSL